MPNWGFWGNLGFNFLTSFHKKNTESESEFGPVPNISLPHCRMMNHATCGGGAQGHE